jgi:hypothetical protein
MDDSGAGISVVILSYNRPAHLARSLASIRAQRVQPAEVIVVDNRSPASDEIARVVRGFPEYALVRNEENRGFAGGMNIGIVRARQPYIYLTEDDVVLEPDCLARLIEFAQKTPDAGLISGLMIDSTNGAILSAGGSLRLDGVFGMTILGLGQRAPAGFRDPLDVEYIPGAMMFARREIWQALGGFREDFFVYYEDSDVCLRARRAGYRISVVPAARAIHLPRADGRRSEQVQFHLLKNFFSLYLLHASWRVWPEFFVRYVILGSVRALPSPRAFWKALAWNMRNLRMLLRDRGKVRPSTATVSR